MKKTFFSSWTLLVASSLLAGATISHAEDPNPPALPETSEGSGAARGVDAAASGQALPSEAQRLGLIKGTGILLGAKVKDSRGKSLGRIRDIVLELATGRALAAMVSSGADAALTPVPPRCFEAVRKDTALLNVDKKTFESAPKLSKDSLAFGFKDLNLTEPYLHFGQPPLEASETDPAGFVSCSSVVGESLLSSANESLGQVSDVMIDLGGGRVLYLVVKADPGLGAAGNLYMLPPGSVQPGASQTLVLNASKEHFLAGPQFNKEYPTDMALQTVAMAVYEHYGLQASAPSSAGPQSVGENLTREVIAEIFHVLTDFQTLKLGVTFSNGRVTLSGTVPDATQRQIILAAAERVAGKENIDNQLQPRDRAKAVVSNQ